MKITSINNNKVNLWAKLKMKKYRDVEHLFIVEGEHLVEEALINGVVKEVISLEEKDYGVPTYEVSLEIMKRLTTLVTPPKVMAVCSFIKPGDIKGNVLILDRIQDPGNLGTMIRSAVAFNFSTIIISSDTVDIYNDKVLRSSEGMIFNVNIIKGDLAAIIPLLKEKKYKVIGTDVKNGVDIKDVKCKNYAIIIGNEGAGMSLEAKELCDAFVYINICKACESLNAAVAASILMNEVYNE